jgi:hypothetical protein
MDAREYKIATSGRDVLGYTVLRESMQFLQNRPELVDNILEAISKGKIEKPSGHNGKDDASTDFYLISMRNERLMEIFDSLTQLITLDEAGNISKSSAAVHALAEKWWKLIDFEQE